MHRILHVINTLNHGGAEHQLLVNVSALDRDSFTSYVCCIQAPGILSSDMAEIGVPVYCLNVKSKMQWPRAVLELRKLIKDLQIDLVHTDLFEGDLIGGVAARLAGVPVVTTLVNIPYQKEWLIDNPNLSWAKLALSKKLLSLVYRTCHSRFIAISQCVKDSSIKYLGLKEDQISIIYRAMAPSWLEADPPETIRELAGELGVAGAYPVLINVGRLMPQKGQRYLFEAMPRVVAEFPEARLLMVGVGFLRDELMHLRDQLGLQEHIIFLGSRLDAKQLLQVSDIFVFPSLFEGLGVSLLEAMGAGKPCIASATGPIPEVVEDGVSGLLVPLQSPDALAEAIIRLARNQRLMKSMGQRGQQIVSEKFAIAQAVEQLEDFYRKALQDSRLLERQSSLTGAAEWK